MLPLAPSFCIKVSRICASETLEPTSKTILCYDPGDSSIKFNNMKSEVCDICGDAVLQALKQGAAYCTETLIFTSITAWCHTPVYSHHHENMKTFI